MAVKIRLKRIGAKKKPFYRIVVADARFPRDGRFIEQIGTYDPMTNPAKVSIDGGKALQWMKHGAQPTDTVRALLKSSGALEKAREEALRKSSPGWEANADAATSGADGVVAGGVDSGVAGGAAADAPHIGETGALAAQNAENPAEQMPADQAQVNQASANSGEFSFTSDAQVAVGDDTAANITREDATGQQTQMGGSGGAAGDDASGGGAMDNSGEPAMDTSFD